MSDVGKCLLGGNNGGGGWRWEGGIMVRSRWKWWVRGRRWEGGNNGG